jgi:large subunit ribosomal protein L31
MRKEGHPKYKKLTIKIGDDEFETNSTYPGDVLLMDIDFRKHPAWVGKGVMSANESNQTVSSFNKKFAGISFGIKKS